MILFDAEDALAISCFNKEIADFLAIAEPAVAMEIKEAANRGEFYLRWSSEKNKEVAEILFSNVPRDGTNTKFSDALAHSLKEAGYSVVRGIDDWGIGW